jgi:predicted unusual protein kinase regulating ubiquinone biosynthesis (AarF/ABC1/UbiB family)
MSAGYPESGDLLVVASTLPRPRRADVVRRLTLAIRSASRHLPAAARKAKQGGNRERLVAAALRQTFDDLGGTFTKFGQLVGSSPSLFGEEVAAEFRGCLDAGAPIPYPDVVASIEDDLGLPLDRLYATFEEKPVAAASLAAVHRATLADGTPVAVKVLRPGIEYQMATDLAVLRPLMHWVSRNVALGIAGELGGLIDGLAEQVAEEVDVRNEARSIIWFEHLRRALGAEQLVVPEPVGGWSGRRVLTMAYIEGVPIDDTAAIDQLGVEVGPLVQETVKAWFATALCTGAFHGDIHAGNLFITPDGRLAVLDWGIVGRLDRETQRFFRRMVEGVLGDDEAWHDVYAHLTAVYGDLAEQMGVTDEQILTFIRLQITYVFEQPFGEVDLTAMLFNDPESAIGGDDGSVPGMDERLALQADRTPREWYQTWRNERQRRRDLLASDAYGSSFDRGLFLLGKQLVYFDRYGKLFLPDTPLLWDRDAFVRLLEAPSVNASEG